MTDTINGMCHICDPMGLPLEDADAHLEREHPDLPRVDLPHDYFLVIRSPEHPIRRAWRISRAISNQILRRRT